MGCCLILDRMSRDLIEQYCEILLRRLRDDREVIVVVSGEDRRGMF